MKPRIKISGSAVHEIKQKLRRHGLHTVCEEARCPNMGECFSRHTAVFMILGNICTRSCKFCNVQSLRGISRRLTTKQSSEIIGIASSAGGGLPPQTQRTGAMTPTLKPPDPNEPFMIAQMAAALGLKHVVITSVARDDLPDEGAGQFAAVIETIRDVILNPPEADEGSPEIECRRFFADAQNDRITIEVLTPDFHAREDCLKTVCQTGPDIFNHNIETVRRLTPVVRSNADYDRSLSVLSWVKKKFPAITVKSGIMLGLGEKEEEIVDTLHDLCNGGAEIVTIGQYLRPSKNCLPVYEYLSPAQFEKYKVIGEKLGIKHLFSGANVRSSYMADAVFLNHC